MSARSSLPRSLLSAVLALAAAASPAKQRRTSFDTPLRKEVKDFGVSPYYGARSDIRVELRCYWYEAFMVKEYDEGQKGSEWHAIVPATEGTIPECTQSHVSSEKVIDGAEWSGYFKGVAGDLVFLDAADGTDSGLPFAIYDAKSGKKVFKDRALLRSRRIEASLKGSPFRYMRVRHEPGQIYLTYLRVVEAECDLHNNRAACWKQVRDKFKVVNSKAPTCLGYEGLPTPFESAVAYPVEVALLPEPRIRPIPGPMRCWPVD